MAQRLLARVVAIILTVALVSACEGSGVLTWEPESQAEQDLRRQAEKLQATKGEGALSGALVGALLGLATGNLGGVATGAQLGRLVGAGAGLYVKSLQSDFATEEARLDQIRDDILQSIEDVNQALDTMRIIAAEQVVQIRTLKEAAAQKKATKAQLDRRRKRVQGNLERMKKAIEGAERREAVFTQTREIVLEENAASNTRSLTEEKVDPHLAVLTARISAMRNIAETLSNEL
ncbi:MAG: hypothetical protein ACFB03_02185 [Paracoccaceae bacterium]